MQAHCLVSLAFVHALADLAEALGLDIEALPVPEDFAALEAAGVEVGRARRRADAPAPRAHPTQKFILVGTLRKT